MEWYCCNGCYVKANKDSYFYITNCLHIYCEKCVNSKCFGRCLTCNDRCSFHKINSTLSQNVKAFFCDLPSLASKLEKEIEEFTAAKQQEAILFAKRKIAEFRMVIQFQLDQTHTFFKKSQFDPEKVEYLVKQINQLNQEVTKFKNENEQLKNRIIGFENTNFSLNQRIFENNDLNPMLQNSESFQFKRNFERDENRQSVINYMLQQPSSTMSNKNEVNSTNIILINQHSNQQHHQSATQLENLAIPRINQSQVNTDSISRRPGPNNLLNESKFVYKTPMNQVVRNDENALVTKQAVSSNVSRRSIGESPAFSSQTSALSSTQQQQQARQILLPVGPRPNSIRSHLLE
ncbi:unnamed protein product [Brachionus calyciflorus]|uniref:RING-type domain-containing protein n=1 Tax=Brachionus calyciflorus TaxID=104777 RepID=A0A813STK9_9BILA|nr:unnamed protein product [Brachionus calyciflorus]